MKKLTYVSIIVLIVVIIDQWSKIWIKTNMSLHESFPILGQNWAFINFIENKGMAFGLSFGGDLGKVLLSTFRVVAVCLLAYFISRVDDRKVSKFLLLCFSLILAGALGNIIDSLFYGMIFSASTVHGGVAEMFPEGGGYAGFMHGKVVDMFYFPMIDTYWPDWVPVLGGNSLQFFRPVFNVADSAISVGIILMILFHRDFFKDPESYMRKKEVLVAGVDDSMESEKKSIQ